MTTKRAIPPTMGFIRHIFYLGLEPYRERYTEMLGEWTCNAMNELNVPFEVVEGNRNYTDSVAPGIRTGQVLDAHGRSVWALTQTANLIYRLRARDKPLSRQDVIYLEDMFHPGYESICYLLAQLPEKERPRIFCRNHAQSVDPNDFTFPMRPWMRHYEEMVMETADAVFNAASDHLLATQAAFPHARASLFRVGLPFDADDVRRRAGYQSFEQLVPLRDRPRKIVFSSRLDAEKQPFFLLEFARELKRSAGNEDVEIVVCSGSDSIRSNVPHLDEIFEAYAAAGIIRLRLSLSKAEYYTELATARAHFLTSLQDWVSYTLLEASALGTPSLAPALGTFAETLDNDDARMYKPWSLRNAVVSASRLLRTVEIQGLEDSRRAMLRYRQPADYHSETNYRIFEIIAAFCSWADRSVIEKSFPGSTKPRTHHDELLRRQRIAATLHNLETYPRQSLLNAVNEQRKNESLPPLSSTVILPDAPRVPAEEGEAKKLEEEYRASDWSRPEIFKKLRDLGEDYESRKASREDFDREHEEKMRELAAEADISDDALRRGENAGDLAPTIERVHSYFATEERETGARDFQTSAIDSLRSNGEPVVDPTNTRGLSRECGSQHEVLTEEGFYPLRRAAATQQQGGGITDFSTNAPGQDFNASAKGDE